MLGNWGRGAGPSLGPWGLLGQGSRARGPMFCPPSDPRAGRPAPRLQPTSWASPSGRASQSCLCLCGAREPASAAQPGPDHADRPSATRAPGLSCGPRLSSLACLVLSAPTLGAASRLLPASQLRASPAPPGQAAALSCWEAAWGGAAAAELALFTAAAARWCPLCEDADHGHCCSEDPRPPLSGLHRFLSALVGLFLGRFLPHLPLLPFWLVTPDSEIPKVHGAAPPLLPVDTPMRGRPRAA